MSNKRYRLAVHATFSGIIKPMKLVITVCLAIFGFAFAYIPYLWGDTNFFSGWSILFSMIGGFFGIFVGYKIGKRWLQ